MEKFIQNLKLSGASNEDINQIIQKSSLTSFKKGAVFSHSGIKWEKIGVLVKGIFGGWYIDYNADKRFAHFYFCPNNATVLDYESYVKDCESKLTIEAITDCEVLVYTREQILEIEKKIPQFLKAEKILAEEKYLEAQKMLDMFQTCNATERIRLIQQHAPEIISNVPYSYIASFLGLHRNSFAEAMKKV